MLRGLGRHICIYFINIDLGLPPVCCQANSWTSTHLLSPVYGHMEFWILLLHCWPSLCFHNHNSLMTYMIRKETPNELLLEIYMKESINSIEMHHINPWNMIVTHYWWTYMLTLLTMEVEFSGFGGSKPCLLMPWHWFCRTDHIYSYFRFDFINLGHNKFKIRFKCEYIFYKL